MAVVASLGIDALIAIGGDDTLSYAARTLISEVPVDMDHLGDLIMADRNRNPSHYAVVVLSEGCTIEGGEIFEGGEADAYGHRKLGGIGQYMGDTLSRKTGVATIN